MATRSIPLPDVQLPPGAPEELAGPPQEVVAPVSRQERISSLDVVRGCALMGILLMNIASFALPEWAYFLPLGTLLPVFSGPHARLNTAAWMLRFIFADGKMRAVFSMLFGAGVILLTERAEKRGAGNQSADIFLRRNMWLVFFGMVHSYLIWTGDILFDYGLVALLFLYPLRKLRPASLLRIAGTVFFLWMAASSVAKVLHVRSVETKGRQAIAVARSGAPLTAAQQSAISAKTTMDRRWWPSTLEAQQDAQAKRAGLLAVEKNNIGESFYNESRSATGSIPDVLVFMVLGMALYKEGFLTGRSSRSVYAWTAATGYAVSISLGAAGTYEAWKSGFEIVRTTAWLGLPYEVCRVAGALAHVSLILLVYKAGIARPLTKAIAAVGQTALSNYLLTSVLCRFLFVWGPAHWFGRVEYYRLFFIVAGVWLVNLLWSTLWLRHFQFGPMEWLWRSLTYWRRQPMRLAGPEPGAEAAAGLRVLMR